MSQLQTLRNQLYADVLAAWTLAPKMGQPGTEPTGAFAVVRLESLDRSTGRGIRHIDLLWSYEIVGMWPASGNWTAADADLWLLDKANALVAVLAPFWEDKDDLQDPDFYAGIGTDPKVTRIEILDDREGDPRRGVRLSFQVITTVYQ